MKYILVFKIELFFLLLFIPIDIFAYPTYNGGDYVEIIKLKTPEYYVIPSNFDNEGEIKVNVKFENSGSGEWYGLIWSLIELPYPDNIEKSLDEIYNDEYHGRYIAIDINDITNSTPIKLDRELFKVKLDHNIIVTTDHTQGNKQDLQLEILDIEQSVTGELETKSLFEFEFTLSSPKFELGRIYEIDLFTNSGGSTVEKFEFVDRTKEIPKIEDIPEAITTTPEISIEEQMRLQQEQALQEYEERKKQQELDEQKEEVSIIEIPDENVEEIIEETPNVESTPEPIVEPIVDPEPIMDSEPQPQCGRGTIVVDGWCKVVAPAKYPSGFDFLFKFFENLFG